MGRADIWTGLLSLTNSTLNELYTDLIVITGVLIYIARSSYGHSLTAGVSTRSHILTSVMDSVSAGPCSSLDVYTMDTFLSVSADSVCLEQTFLSTHFFSSRGNAATLKRPTDATFINTVQRKTLLNTFKLSLLNNQHWLGSCQPQSLTFRTYPMSCIT